MKTIRKMGMMGMMGMMLMLALALWPGRAPAFHFFVLFNGGAFVTPAPGVWSNNWTTTRGAASKSLTNNNALPMSLTFSNWGIPGALGTVWGVTNVTLAAGGVTNIWATNNNPNPPTGTLTDESDSATILWVSGDERGTLQALANWKQKEN